jgi:hypothetical protein
MISSGDLEMKTMGWTAIAVAAMLVLPAMGWGPVAHEQTGGAVDLGCRVSFSAIGLRGGWRRFRLLRFFCVRRH